MANSVRAEADHVDLHDKEKLLMMSEERGVIWGGSGLVRRDRRQSGGGDPFCGAMDLGGAQVRRKNDAAVSQDKALH